MFDRSVCVLVIQIVPELTPTYFYWRKRRKRLLSPHRRDLSSELTLEQLTYPETNSSYK